MSQRGRRGRARPGAVLLLAVTAALARGGEIKVEIVSQNGRGDFLQAVQAGAQKAALGTTITFLPAIPAANAGEQVRAIENARPGAVDGILLAPLDHDELAPPVARALERKIAVVAIDSSVDVAAVPEVAADNREEGRVAARELAQILGGKGSAVLLRNQINAANTEAREEGFQEVIRTQFPGIHLVCTDFHAGATVETAQHVAATILGVHQGEIDGVFASGEIGTLGMLAALRQAKLNGTVKLIGVDEGSPDLALALKSGEVQGLIAPDDAAMGAEAMRVLIRTLHGDRAAGKSIPFRLVTAAGAILPPAATLPAKTKPTPLIPRNTHLAKGDFIVPDLGLIMVEVDAPAGKYWLGRYEVRQNEWTSVMGSNPSDFHGDDLPVDNVGWNDARTFCEKLTARERAATRLPHGFIYTLPTEVQWGWACRAGTAEGGSADDAGWSADNSGAVDPATGIWHMRTHPVGQKQPNAWSFCDMLGNVAEWCLEPYAEHPGEPAALDKNGQPYRILRGGAWWTDVQNCGAEARHKAPADRHHSGLGLRVALSPAP